MTNYPKARGTRFESDVRRHMVARLGDPRIERRALAGSRDKGDLRGIYAHGWEGIAECKSHKDVTPGMLAEWRRQSIEERGNADADFVLLIVRRPNRAVGRSDVHVTVGDLCLLVPGVSALVDGAGDDAWVSMTLDECCDLIGGKDE